MKINIQTLGCPKNFNDSEVCAGILEANGHIITDDLLEADAILVNTCGFINDAKKESIEKIFEMATLKDNGCLLIVSGCLAERYADELFKEMPEVDIMLGVNDYERLPNLLAEYMENKERKINVSHNPCNIISSKYRKYDKNPYTATIKIAEGCDNRCAYCIIPMIRGGYRSVKIEDIITEAKLLAEKGCKELILIAQDVTYYGTDIYGKAMLPELLKHLCKIDGIKWIRLMYCYEDRITDELIDVMATETKICHYIDIPIQHASDKILGLMKRRSTKASILNTISRLRKAIPDIHIRTTLITGFPGESKAEFDELLSFVDEIGFERLGVFAYSKEEGTEGYSMKPQVREDVKKRRAETIMRRQVDISLEKNKKKIGKILEVLVEEQDEEGAYIGRSVYDAPEIDNSVIFKGNNNIKIGEIIKVEITDAFDYDLVGREI